MSARDLLPIGFQLLEGLELLIVVAAQGLMILGNIALLLLDLLVSLLNRGTRRS